MSQLPAPAATLRVAVAVVVSLGSQAAYAAPVPSAASVSTVSVSGMDPSMPGMDPSMPGMDHGSMPGMDHGSMPGMDHGTSSVEGASSSGSATHDHTDAGMVTETSSDRPRALVLGGFAALNGAALITAFILRTRRASPPRRRPRTAATVAAR